MQTKYCVYLVCAVLYLHTVLRTKSVFQDEAHSTYLVAVFQDKLDGLMTLTIGIRNNDYIYVCMYLTLYIYIYIYVFACAFAGFVGSLIVTSAKQATDSRKYYKSTGSTRAKTHWQI